MVTEIVTQIVRVYCWAPNGVCYDPAGQEPFVDQAMTEMLGTPQYIFPANSTTEPPPPIGSDEVAVRDGDRWLVKKDYRGRTCWEKATGKSSVVSDFGPLPDTMTFVEPPAGTVKWDGAGWEQDVAAEVEKARRTKTISIKNRTNEIMDAGISVGGKLIACDTRTQLVMLCISQGMERGKVQFPFDAASLNGKFTVQTEADFNLILDGYFAKIVEAVNGETILIDRVLKATNVVDIQAIEDNR